LNRKNLCPYAPATLFLFFKSIHLHIKFVHCTPVHWHLHTCTMYLYTCTCHLYTSTPLHLYPLFPFPSPNSLSFVKLGCAPAEKS
jgi:hypothetical protein